jgi:Na+/glutamate symporter
MNNKKNTSLLKYAGLATQFFVGIGLCVFGGTYLDKWMKFTIPIAAWILPLLFIIAVIIRIIKDTSPKP